MKYWSVEDLRSKCARRIPFFSFEYLESGTGIETAKSKNVSEFVKYSAKPRMCQGIDKIDISTETLGFKYDVPFGIAPVGLSGLIWPKAEILLMKAASVFKSPYILSTVATETIESVSKEARRSEDIWFQLYTPKKMDVLEDLLKRAKDSGCKVLVITLDIPTPSIRERSKRVGVSIPVKFSFSNIFRAVLRPRWSLETLLRGLPKLRNIEKYSGTNIKFSANYAGNRMGGVLTWESCEEIIQMWDGPVIAKGIMSEYDIERAIKAGFSGLYVSNHGGRQFDGATPSLSALQGIARANKSRLPIYFDGGVRTGLDILKAVSLGADFVFLGRPFLYGLGANGFTGVSRSYEILREDLINNMFQLGLKNISDIKKYTFEKA